LKTMLKTSFHGADAGTGTQASEHYGKGFHKFPNGTTAARPAAGNAGRIYLNTDEQRIERDTGAAWALLNAVPLEFAHTSTSTTVYYFSETDMQTVTVDVPTGARLLCLGSFRAATQAGEYITVKFVVDGTDLSPIYQHELDGKGHMTWGYSASPTTGSITVKLVGQCSATNQSIAQRALLVAVV